MSRQELKEQKVTIKLIPNPDNEKIPLKYVNAIEYATPKTDRSGKIVTGLDENSLAILKLPVEEQKVEINKIKKLRESLEKLLGVDLTPGSQFWSDGVDGKTPFVICLEDDIILDLENPRDILNEKFLVANRYVAPSLEDHKNDENYHHCLFYLHKEKEVLATKSRNQKLIDKATAKLFLLNEDNPNKLILVASYVFGFDINPNMDPDEAYLKLKDYLESKDDISNQKKNIEIFLDAVNKTPEEIMIKKILDKAVKKRIVVKRADKYSREDEDYGAYDEALIYLGLPENTAELAYLKKKTGM